MTIWQKTIPQKADNSLIFMPKSQSSIFIGSASSRT